MLFEKFIIRPDIRQFGPCTGTHWRFIKVVDFGMLYRQQKWGMSSDNKLAAEKTGGLF